MSQNVKKKSSARERLQAERAREKRAEARRRRIVIGASIGAVVLIGGGIAIAVGTANGSGGTSAAAVAPAHTSGPDDTVIVYGKTNAPNTLDLWEDFRCPICDALEKTDGATIQKLADDGTYKINYHMATFLDGNLGGTGSKTALSAAGAALNEGVGKFKQFHDVLYANQPDEQDDAFASKDRILDLASEVPGLKTAAFTKAVRNGTYDDWVGKVSDAFNHSGVTGTPTVKLNGKTLTVFDKSGQPLTPAQYTALVQQSAAAKK
jgi:protein-disulfide isomerase